MPKVQLRRPTLADAPALIAANIASRDHHHPWVQGLTDEAGFEAWLARANSDDDAGFIAFAGDEVAGVVNLNNIIRGRFQNAFLGYYGTAEHAGTGAMTEAVRQAIDVGFGELGLHRLEANIQPGNARSVALVRRLGFRLEGFSPRYLCIGGKWRDHQRWALLSDDPGRAVDQL